MYMSKARLYYSLDARGSAPRTAPSPRGSAPRSRGSLVYREKSVFWYGKLKYCEPEAEKTGPDPKFHSESIGAILSF